MKISKRIYRRLLTITESAAGIDRAKELDALFRFHRKMNIRNPRTLAEKIAWIEYHAQSPLAASCTDKWEVRDYVRRKGLEDILIPVYGTVRTKKEELDLTALPEQFVIKATHGCAMNLVCSGGKVRSPRKIEKTIQDWLDTTYGGWSLEPHYKEIPHRFYIEKYLGSSDEMVDYKFYCCNGKPQFTEVCFNRSKGLKLALFDMEWNPIEAVTGRHQAKKGEIPGKPAGFCCMKKIAETLSEDFLFVRVDLYEVGGKIYFGELTFTPSNCVMPNFTSDFLMQEGRKLHIWKSEAQMQVLLATMNQKDFSFTDRMNLRADTLAINQITDLSTEFQNLSKEQEYLYRQKYQIRMITRKEQGVGKSRNLALEKASAEYLLFADDDICYADDFRAAVVRNFRKYPDADILIFELEKEGSPKSYRISKSQRIHWFNYQKYGMAHVAVRKSSVMKAGIRFSEDFGGGARFSCGEDSIFLHDCLKNRLKIRTVPVSIGTLKSSPSTWFHGFTDKYYRDRGHLFYELGGPFGYVFALRFAFRHRGKSEKNFSEIMKLLAAGIRAQRNYHHECK